MRERNQMSQVKITWKAFGDKPEIGRFISSVEFETEFKIDESNVDKFLGVVYQQTNLYGGNLWKIIEPKLSATRTHTSLSIGDEIEVDGQVYICADFGFEKIEDVEIKRFSDDSIFRVVKKDKVDN
jgi:hypothetical protein